VILLGPATESYTYAILAPAVSLGLVAAFSGPASKVARGLVGLSAAMMLSAQIKSSLFSGWRNDWFNGMRPAGALLLTVFVILWLREDGMWEGSGVAAGEAAAS
jgi:hypothetical protein